MSSPREVVGNPSRVSDLPCDPGGVGLGPGERIVRTVDPVDLAEPDAWRLDIGDHNGATGPLSVLDGITRLAPIDDILVQDEPHSGRSPKISGSHRPG